MTDTRDELHQDTKMMLDLITRITHLESQYRLMVENMHKLNSRFKCIRCGDCNEKR